jgi:hypothetical protein
MHVVQVDKITKPNDRTDTIIKFLQDGEAVYTLKAATHDIALDWVRMIKARQKFYSTPESLLASLDESESTLGQVNKGCIVV